MISYRASSILTLMSFGVLWIAPDTPPLPQPEGSVSFDCSSMWFYRPHYYVSPLMTMGTLVILLIQGLRERRASPWISYPVLLAFCAFLFLYDWEPTLCSTSPNLAASIFCAIAYGFLYLRHLIPDRNHRQATAVYTV